MIADNLLQHLEKVKKNGQNKWLACCPAHADKSPSLAIKELDDGRLLIHCFGGCSVSEIVASVGLKLEDLFPINDNHHKGERRPFPAADVLRALRDDITICMLVTADVLNGKKLTEQDFKRVVSAKKRFDEALKYSRI